MLKYTLDTNCLIDVDEGRPSAFHIHLILEASRNDAIDVAMVASSASERQRDGNFLDDITTFRSRMNDLGFGHLKILLPLGRWDIGFWDSALWADNETIARERLIYCTLFPGEAVEWADFAAARAVDPDAIDNKAFFRWRNQILDAQAFWSHEWHKRDIFVTSDQNFKKRLVGAPDFSTAVICEPEEAARTL